MPQLRQYQVDLLAGIDYHWAKGDRHVLGVAPTGSGKTVLFSHALAREQCATVAIAHRQELVTQMSLALARNGVRHGVIGPDNVARACVSLHVGDVGRSFYDPAARCRVAGVDTLVRRDPKADPWFQQVGLVVQDEAHHVLRDNKWGAASLMFPNARTLGVTATPTRADGKGLGEHSDGIFQAMVEGPSMRDLINEGFLTEYRVFVPPVADLDLSEVPTSASGDFSPPKLRAAVHKSNRIVGDVVAHYQRLAAGKLGVTFAVDVESAVEIANAYKAAGVPAEVVTAETPDLLRASILRRFRNREVMQLCNVDLFGEGFDLPAIEVVSMARPTQSYSLYVQQFGRALRLLDGKEFALIIDHVGNVLRHGLPDRFRRWSLDRREKRATGGASDTIPMRVCVNCTAAYEGYHAACPYCGFVRVPVGRGTMEQVDGVLLELDPAVLARMRGELVEADSMVPPFGMPDVGRAAYMRRQYDRHIAQQALRAVMALWGGWQTHLGRDEAEGQRRFFFRFGMSVHDAWMLDREGAEKLKTLIDIDLSTNNVKALA